MARLHPSFAFALPLCALALAGCPSNPAPRDSGTPTDAPVVLVDSPMVLADTPGSMADVPTTGRDCTAAGACDVILQNCATAGQGCYLNGTTTECLPIAGTLPEGSPCTDLNGCADGLHCAGDPSFCRAYCCMGSSGDCPIGHTCLNYIDGGGLGVCVPPSTCTVVPQSGCGMNQACMPQEDDTLLCVAAGTVAIDGTCGMTAGNCVAGAICVGPTGGPTTCRPICRIAMGMADCGGTVACQAVGMFSTSYGICPAPAP